MGADSGIPGLEYKRNFFRRRCHCTKRNEVPFHWADRWFGGRCQWVLDPICQIGEAASSATAVQLRRPPRGHSPNYYWKHFHD